MLSESDDVDVVGTASSGRQAVDLAASLRPDAVVMDLHMGDLDGIEATRRIVKAAPETAVLALTMHDDDASLRATVDAGARGYLLKEASGEDVVRALRSVTRGTLFSARRWRPESSDSWAARPRRLPCCPG